MLNRLSVFTSEQGRSVMLLPLVFFWLLFVGGTVGEVDDDEDEDETEFALVSLQIKRILTHDVFPVIFLFSLIDQS